MPIIMGDSKAFISTPREVSKKRPVSERIHDWKEVYLPMAPDTLKTQASRCMDCGVPFCHNGCPLGNLIPDWNDLVYKGDWLKALNRSPLSGARPAAKPAGWVT